MSTTYEPIPGLLEVPVPAIRKSEYLPSDLHVTRFFGGKDRGVSISLGINDEEGYKDIQLDNKSPMPCWNCCGMPWAMCPSMNW